MQLPEATLKRWYFSLVRKFSEKAQKTEALRLFWQEKKVTLEELLRGQAIFLGSNMMITIPEIKVPRATRSAIEERIFSSFGQNIKFFSAFFNFFTAKPIEVHVALSKIRELFELPDPSHCRPRKMIALFYTMITKSDFVGFAWTPEDFIKKLEAIKEILVKGKDPLEEFKFNQYIEELIEGFRPEMMSDNY